MFHLPLRPRQWTIEPTHWRSAQCNSSPFLLCRWTLSGGNFGGKNGIRVYRSSDLSEVAQDTDYDDSSYWAEFDRRGQLVTTNEDGYVRLYNADFTLLAKERAPGGKDPFSARFSPDGSKIAVGFDDSTAVNVLSGKDLSLLYAPDTKGVEHGNLMSVAWSQDGEVLYAAGRYIDSANFVPILKWNKQGRGTATQIPASANSVVNLHALKQGRLVFGASDPLFGVLAADGRKILTQGPEIADHRSNQEKFQVSRDGAVVAFGFDVVTDQVTWSRRAARFDLNERRLTLDPPATNALSPPQTTGLNITGWDDTTEPRLNGKRLSLDRYETSFSLAIARDSSQFLLGTHWSLRLFNRDGAQRWQTPVPGTIWAVNLSGDGRYALAALGDGTIRWYTIKDGKEVLAFFPHRDGKRWVAWTPEGFFDSAEGGEALIGYHLNQGSNHSGEFVKSDQLTDLFYRPDLVAKRLQGGQEDAIKEALARIGDVRQVLAGGLPPQLELLSPKEVTQSDGDFVLTFKVTDQGGGIGRVRYRINGQELEGRDEGISVPGQSPVSRRFSFAPGRSVLSATAYNGKNQIESRAIETIVNVKSSGERPSLHVLSVGVTNYDDDDLDLKYAADDASAVADELAQRGKAIFQEPIRTRVLTDEKATLANITQTFEQLANEVKATDVFVLYLAGHGTAVDGNYHFIPWELKIENEDALRNKSLSNEKLQTLLSKISATRSLVLLDTCRAGSALTLASRSLEEKTAIARLMAASGRAIIAASTSQQMALEANDDRHGVFTYAVLKGLKGEADYNKNSDIEVDELALFVTNVVPEITTKRWNYKQVPMRDLQGASFPIGRRP